MVGLLETLLLLVALAPGPPPAEGYCVDCHARQEEARLRIPTASVAASVHAQLPHTCVACHGGDVREPTLRAHSADRGFRGKPTFAQVPLVCGGCHADPAFMRPYSAGLPVDQLALYRTSHHGRELAAGATDVAVCTSCHGVHDIRPVSNPASPVHPLHVAKTCGKCHSKPDHRPLSKGSKDPVAAYRRSVHAKALFEDGDISAPTCNDCHGDHGAAPPGVRSIHRACGACHVQQSDLFMKSPHSAPFAKLGFGECDECHGRHDISPASDAMLRPGEANVCTPCHTEGTAGAESARNIREVLEKSAQRAGEAKAARERAAHVGLLVPKAELAERDLFTAAQRLRISVHGLDPAALEVEVAAIDAAAETIVTTVEAAEAELKTTRRGYIVFIVLIGMMIVLLLIKLRRLTA